MGVRIGGIAPFSATDYPGRLSAVLFVQGCPWRCGYCHNPHLQKRAASEQVPWDEFCLFLKRRTGLLDAVVFSGGEPCADPGLIAAVNQVRNMGFGVGLHTAGIYPRRLVDALPVLQWVGLDIKGTPDQYDAITCRRGSAISAYESLRLLIASGIAFEVRTTLQPGLHNEASLRVLAQHLSALGVAHYVVQVFSGKGCTNAALMQTPPWVPSHAFQEELALLFNQFSVRAEV